MERRYKRANDKNYAKKHTRNKKRKFGIPLKIQSTLCIFLFTVGALISFIGKNGAAYKKITHTLYHTNTYDEWQKIIIPTVTYVKTGSLRAVAMWNDAIQSCEKKLGIDAPKSSAPVNAKAQKEDKKTVKKTEQKPAERKTDLKEEKPLSFRVPVDGEITSQFGERIHPISGNASTHTGIDIAANHGATVISAAPGVVATTGNDDANGSYVIIKHDESLTTVYAHLSKICVSNGETVNDNTKIGEVGSSGISTGPHLHFEVKLNSKSVDPENYVTLKHKIQPEG